MAGWLRYLWSGWTERSATIRYKLSPSVPWVTSGISFNSFGRTHLSATLRRRFSASLPQAGSVLIVWSCICIEFSARMYCWHSSVLLQASRGLSSQLWWRADPIESLRDRMGSVYQERLKFWAPEHTDRQSFLQGCDESSFILLWEQLQRSKRLSANERSALQSCDLDRPSI